MRDEGNDGILDSGLWNDRTMQVPWCNERLFAFAICIPLAFAFTYARYLEQKNTNLPD